MLRKPWWLIGSGAVLLAGPLVAVHLPLGPGLHPGQRVGLAEVAHVCRGTLGQLAQAFSGAAGRGCRQAGLLTGAARAAEVLGALGILGGVWALRSRRAASHP